MKVVVVKVGEYSDQTIVGVFSSEEKANDYIMRNTSPKLYYESPYIDGEYEIDDPSLFTNNMDNPVMYLTKFGIKKDKGNVIIKLGENGYPNDDCINVKVKTYNKREISVNLDLFYPSTKASGYIVLEKEYSKDKLTKIIADKVYQEMYNNIANINIVCDSDTKEK